MQRSGKTSSILCIVRTVLATFGIWLAALTMPFAAAGASDATDHQEATASQLETLVKETVENFFHEVGLRKPEEIKIDTGVGIDASAPRPRVAWVDLNVTLVTEQPSEVVRETRQRLLRALAAQGYSTGSTEGTPDEAPRATLKIEVDSPLAYEKDAGMREYLTLGALVLASLTGFFLTFQLMLLPWRRRAAAVADAAAMGHAVQATTAQRRGEPHVDLPFLPSIPPVGLTDQGVTLPIPETPPPERTERRVEAERPARVACPDEVRKLAEALTDSSTGGWDFAALRNADAAVVRALFDEMPFEKFLDLLVVADPETRRGLIDKLELNPAVRRRLEKGISYLEESEPHA